jgi:hypothetical protein
LCGEETIVSKTGTEFFNLYQKDEVVAPLETSYFTSLFTVSTKPGFENCGYKSTIPYQDETMLLPFNGGSVYKYDAVSATMTADTSIVGTQTTVYLKGRTSGQVENLEPVKLTGVVCGNE